MEIVPTNNQIVHLAAAISEADDSSIPALLLKIRDFLDAESYGTKQRNVLISEIWKYDLPAMIVTVLKQEFTLIPGSWLTACQLCSTVVDCCIDYISNSSVMKDQFLPGLIYTILQAMTKVINEYSKVDKLFKANLCGNLSWMVTALTNLMSKFIFTTITVVSSKHFMQFLMTEDSKLSLVAFSLLKNVVQANRDVFYHVAESRSHNIADELTFKITSATDADVARVSMSVLLLLMDVHTPLLQLFSSKRYRGFKTYVSKWTGFGFDNDIKRLIKILDSQSDHQLISEKLGNAAIIIQSCYRGHRTRKRLKQASHGIAKFQRIYRSKKLKKDEESQTRNLERMKKEYVEVNRRKAFVNSRSKQLKVVEGIPAKTVTKFFDKLEHESAKKIQAAWVGTKTRKLLKDIEPELRKRKAAVMIQRQIRKWLERCKRRRAAALTDLLPPGLSDERKIELQNVITKIRERFPGSARNDEELLDLHEETFRMLNNHVISLRQVRRRDKHRKALLAQLSVQSDHMSYIPQLDNINRDDIEKFSSRSAPIIIAARKQHLDYINDVKKPWWKRLESHYDQENNASIKRDYAEVNGQFLQEHDKQF